MGFLGAVMHYYKRNIGDYAKKAGRLTMLQHGSYTLLIDSCYDRERFPTLDEAFEWTWASTQDERDAVSFVLRKFFTVDADGLYVQNHIREDIEAYHENSATNKRIAIEREEARRTKRAQTVNEAPPNHKPLTTNQEPIEEPRKRVTASYDAPDWVPQEQWKSFVQMRKAIRGVPFTEAAAKGVVRELEKLRDQGHSPAQMLENSVMNGWRSVFAPKTALQGKTWADTKADIAHSTVPGTDGPDPALAKILADEKKAAPMPDYVRQAREALKRTA